MEGSTGRWEGSGGPPKNGVNRKDWQLVVVLLCASTPHTVNLFCSKDCLYSVPTVCWVSQRAYLLCAKYSPQSVPTVCQVLYINPVYCRPDVVHKECLLCAGCSLKFMPTKCQEHSIKHNYCVEGTLCKACLLCAKYST